jgi:hypothetical protein
MARLSFRRKKPTSPQHPVYYGHRLPERIVHVAILGACDTCHEERDYDLPCPHCGDIE